jgi:hypothetical protein
VPPVALQLKLANAPTVVGLGPVFDVIPRGETMVRVKALTAEPPNPSLTVTVKFANPGIVGVPEITPPALRDKPAGKLPAVTE